VVHFEQERSVKAVTTEKSRHKSLRAPFPTQVGEAAAADRFGIALFGREIGLGSHNPYERRLEASITNEKVVEEAKTFLHFFDDCMITS
jgi:hypothetical protein